MTTPSTPSPDPTRGELWLIRFDPTQGPEIGKTRPAIVVNPRSVGRLPLRIVVPITGWNPKFARVPWLVQIKPRTANGLSKTSAADCFQVKSVSVKRFASKLGDLRGDEVEEISAAIALCVGA